MSTEAFDVACSIPLRIAELKRFTYLAEIALGKEKDEDTYNTLCRACCVLLSSHLEGFLKEVEECFIDDLQEHFKTFSNMPEAIQVTFCEKIAYYEGVPPADIKQRIQQLRTFFTTNSVAINLRAFTYKENPNRNPGPDVIEAMFSKIGVPSVLNSMAGGVIDNVFENDPAVTYILRRELCRFRATLFSFPYKPLPKKYVFNHRSGKSGKNKGNTSFWHTYIEEIMQRRHKIVHGDTLENHTNVTELNNDIEKLEILMHALIFSSASYFTRSIANP